MLSGEFESVPYDSLWVDRSERIRKVLTPEAVEEKRESIARLGLIHPLVVTREGKIVSGETRYTALGLLGWDHVPVQYADTLDPKELLAIELEENIKRTDLSWQDQCDALRKYHALQSEMHETWTQVQTAAALGLSPAAVTQQLAVAAELEAGNSKVLGAPKYSVARGIVARQKERKVESELAAILAEGSEPAAPPPETPILTANFNEWAETYSGPSFNLIHCDFPYGINADKFAQGAADAFGGYEDKPETYWALVDTLLRHKEKLLGTSGHIIFWFSMRFYAETLSRLSEHFWVDPYPLIWHKSDNKGTLPDPSRGPRRVYEVAFLCSHGDRKIISAVSNTFSGPTVRTADHMSEKSQAMLEHFFRMVVDENTRMLDPTAGSGSALRAARTLGAGSMLGLEMNPDFAENARKSWLSNG